MHRGPGKSPIEVWIEVGLGVWVVVGVGVGVGVGIGSGFRIELGRWESWCGPVRGWGLGRSKCKGRSYGAGEV